MASTAEQLNSIAPTGAIAEAEARTRRWIELMNAGVLIDLTLGHWRAAMRASPKDLGLELDEEEVQRFHAEWQDTYLLLAPQGAMQPLATALGRVQSALQQYSFPVRLGEGAVMRFVPATALERWWEVHQAEAADVQKAVAVLVERWDELHAATLTAHTKHAEHLYQRLVALRLVSPRTTPREGFVRAYLARIEQRIVSSEAFARSVRCEATPMLLPTATALGATMQAAAPQVQAVMSAYYADKKKQLIDDFINNVQGELRRRLYDGLTASLDSITRAGKLHDRTAVAIRRLLDMAGMLKFWDDAELDKALAEVRQAVAEAPQVQPEALAEKLREFTCAQRAILLDLGVRVRTPRTDLDVPVALAAPVQQRGPRAALGVEQAVLPLPIQRGAR